MLSVCFHSGHRENGRLVGSSSLSSFAGLCFAAAASDTAPINKRPWWKTLLGFSSTPSSGQEDDANVATSTTLEEDKKKKPADDSGSRSSTWKPTPEAGSSSTKKVEETSEVLQEDSLDLKSPLLNRELTASVKAHAWPTLPSNALCEAVAFFQQEDYVLQTNHATQRLDDEDDDGESTIVAQFLNGWTKKLLESDSSALTLPLLDWKTALDWVLDIVSGSDVSFSLSHFRPLLQWSLQLRANSPLCEVQRGLARQTLQQTNRLVAFGDSALLAVLFSLDRPATVMTNPAEVYNMDWTQLVDASSEKGDGTNSSLKEEGASTLEDHLLPQEVPLLGPRNVSTASSLLIVYTRLDSIEFAQTYGYLKDTLENSNVPVLVRSLGAVHYEENPLSAEPTTLAGYGVRLDIRNVEYKVFDERKTSTTADQQDQVMINLTESKDLSSSFLAGVNLSALVDDKDTPLDATLELRNQLWNKDEGQQAQARKIPPLWQRRQLPLQAAAVLAQQNQQDSGDVLVTLTQLAYDLPSVASALVQVKIPPQVHEWASAVSNGPDASNVLSAGQLFVNGRVSSVTRPSFNVFEILNVIRMEERRVHRLEKTLYPHVSYLSSSSTVLQRLQYAWMAGSKFGVPEGETESEEDEDPDESSSASMKTYRVDIGRGWQKAIIYLNDVEKDQQYKSWTRSFQQMLMGLQFGMPPSIRRNMYTITLVIDPTIRQNSDEGNTPFDFAMKLVQSQYPARVGLVIVDSQDLEKCRSWLQQNDEDKTADQPCPVEPSILKDDDDLTKTKGTAHAFHRLLNLFLSEYGSLGASLPFVEYYFNYIEEQFENTDTVTMEDLVRIYSTLLEMMGVGTSEAVRKDAEKALLASETDSSSENQNVYGKSLRFAAERGLRPGMSFLNGRPLPEGTDGIHKTFSDEHKSLMNMIMTGELTDSSPKSIFGKLLSGPEVFGRMHPLLLQDEHSADAYQPIQHPFDSDSLLIRGESSKGAEAYFVIDVVLDYASPQGLAQLNHLMESIENFPTSHSNEEKDGEEAQSYVVGYRILPASAASSASPLCPVLAKAGLISLSTLRSAVKTAIESGEEVKTLDEFISDMDEGTGQLVKSSRNQCLSGFSYITDSTDGGLVPRVVCNGRVYEMGDSDIMKEDIDLLVSLEIQRAAAVFDIFKDFVPEEVSHGQIAESVSGVAQYLAVEQTKTSNREDVMKPVRKLEKKLNMEEEVWMRFQWNEPTDQDGRLKSRIMAVVDPVHESTQRMAPLLEIIRDQLNLPITIILVPSPSIDGESKVPVTSYYRFVTKSDENSEASAYFSSLPVNHVLTLRMDIPEPWEVQQTLSIQDTDNLRCDLQTGCGDDAHVRGNSWTPASIKSNRQITNVEYGLNHLLAFGQCYEANGPPNGLQLALFKHTQPGLGSVSEVEAEVSVDGVATMDDGVAPTDESRYSDTLVMKTVGYWQLRANPGVWEVHIDEKSKGAEMFDFAEAKMVNGRLAAVKEPIGQKRNVVLKDFVNRGETLIVKRRPGYEKASLFFDESSDPAGLAKGDPDDGVIHVFSLATGHLYERFLKIMMLSVTKRTSSKVKFWLFENFLSPNFKATSRAMANRIGCEVEFVTYKWPEWLRGQTEKQRIIWGYKILFLDVLFPLSVKKIIYVDADQVVRADLKELWDMDLKGRPCRSVLT